MITEVNIMTILEQEESSSTKWDIWTKVRDIYVPYLNKESRFWACPQA